MEKLSSEVCHGTKNPISIQNSGILKDYYKILNSHVYRTLQKHVVILTRKSWQVL